MNVRLLNIIQNVFYMIYIVILIILLYFNYQSQREMLVMHQLQEEAHMVVNELQNSSDRLTMMARLYVETGELKYKNYYLTILDIRNGLVPRPADYDSIYWDRVLSGQIQVSQGTVKSFDSIIKDSKLTSSELKLLLEAESQSNQLAKIEKKAFEVTEQYLKNKDDVSDQERKAARELLVSDIYMKNKEAIMLPIRQCEQQIQIRTQHDINSLVSLQKLYLQLTFVVTIISGIIIFILRLLTMKCFIKPLKILLEQSQKITAGNFTVRNKIEEKHEIGALGKSINQMLDVIEEDQHKLIELSYTDGLTGIANRRKFDDYFRNVWGLMRREQKCVSLIMLDIDFFKKYNDQYGHKTGDDCLVSIAKTLELTVKREIDLVARYGGEEFVCVLPDTRLEDAMQIAEKMRINIIDLGIPHRDSSVESIVTISAGVACIFPNDTNFESDLVQASDRGLYKAKIDGRNRVSIE